MSTRSRSVMRGKRVGGEEFLFLFCEFNAKCAVLNYIMVSSMIMMTLESTEVLHDILKRLEMMDKTIESLKIQIDHETSERILEDTISNFVIRVNSMIYQRESKQIHKEDFIFRCAFVLTEPFRRMRHYALENLDKLQKMVMTHVDGTMGYASESTRVFFELLFNKLMEMTNET